MKDFIQIPINNRCLYCAGTDLHVIVNNNMLAAIITKMLVISICLGVQH